MTKPHRRTDEFRYALSALKAFGAAVKARWTGRLKDQDRAEQLVAACKKHRDALRQDPTDIAPND